MKIDNYKELSAIFHCDKFVRWREKFPGMDDIPDNELVYIIFDGLVKAHNRDTDLVSALHNAAQFTGVVDSSYYLQNKEEVFKWLIEGSGLYKNEIARGVCTFSEIKHIYTQINLKLNYIVVSMCGVKRVKNDQKYFNNSSKCDDLFRLLGSSYRPGVLL